MKKKKQLYLAIILTLVIVIGVGYAFLTSNLIITGNTTIKDNTWNIHFENFAPTTGSVTATSAGIDTSDTTKVNYTITLAKPGDFYEFTVDAVNNGSLDAMIDTVSNTGISQTQQNYLTYSVKYDDGLDVAANQLLEHSQSEKIKVRVEFLKSVSNANLPSTDQAITLTFTINYKQADDSAVPIRNYVCKRATSLHTDDKDTYGNLGSGETLTPGDAFDCDVNKDNIYNSETERFYYVTDLDTNSNYAVFIYYNNIEGITPSNRASDAYDSDNTPRLNGPLRIVEDLPTTSQWPNVSLTNTTRKIKDETGTEYIDFSYAGHAARLLTYPEVITACGEGTPTAKNYLENCTYLMENTYYSDKYNRFGYWLETVSSSTENYAWNIYGFDRKVYSYRANYQDPYGARPVIEILKSKIKY